MQEKVVMVYSKIFRPHEGWYLRAYNQARTLVAAGCDVTLLAWDRECRFPREEVVDGFRIKRFRIRAGEAQGPRNAVKVSKFNWAVLRFLLRNDFDIVHCFNLDTILVGLLAAKFRKKKAILDLCEPDYYRGFWDKRFSFLLHGINWLEKTFAKRFDHLFVHNTYQIKKFRSYGITHLTQAGSYPNRSMLADGVRRKESPTVVIGRLGTIYANNGFEELVVAFRLLLDRKAASGKRIAYKLLLAGKVFDSYLQTFQSLVQPLEGHVEILGAFQPEDLSRLYRAIDISILIYGKRWFGNVTPTKLFESLANGVPVVANGIGDVPQIVEEGECGVIVDENDPASICEGIALLASDQKLRKSMSEKALKLAREKYTWEACQERFLEVYRSF